jgi:hypothetical protein
MNIYKLGEQTIVIIDGEPYLKLEQQTPAIVEPVPARHYQKKIKKVEEKPLAKVPGKKQTVSDEIKDQIRQKFSDGVSRQDLVKEFGLSYQTITKYCQLKPMSQRTTKKDVNDYVCENGHEFRSKLLPGNVMCPTCHSLECELGSLNGPVKEDVE